MAKSGVAAGGGVLGIEGEGEGVAGEVVGGDVVVGERGGWSSRVVGVRAGASVLQRGRTDEASAQSITIAHSVWRWVQGGAPLEECSTRNARDSSAPVGRSTRRDQEFPLSERRPSAGAHTPCKACRSCPDGERGRATLLKARVGERVGERFDAVSCFDAGLRARPAWTSATRRR